VDNLPKHIAVIMDGNGRWARQRGKPRSSGHQSGVKATRSIVRPETEVKFLMELFVKAIRSELNKLHENNIRVRFIGELSRFSAGLLAEITTAEEKTADNSGMKLNIAVNYGGRGSITEDTVAQHTWLADCPEPDLFVRTGGEQRLSNYLLWHLAYTELAFTDTLWPDFNGDELDRIIEEFAHRQRRFGQTGEQVQV